MNELCARRYHGQRRPCAPHQEAAQARRGCGLHNASLMQPLALCGPAGPARDEVCAPCSGLTEVSSTAMLSARMLRRLQTFRGPRVARRYVLVSARTTAARAGGGGMTPLSASWRMHVEAVRSQRLMPTRFAVLAWAQPVVGSQLLRRISLSSTHAGVHAQMHHGVVVWMYTPLRCSVTSAHMHTCMSMQVCEWMLRTGSMPDICPLHVHTCAAVPCLGGVFGSHTVGVRPWAPLRDATWHMCPVTLFHKQGLT